VELHEGLVPHVGEALGLETDMLAHLATLLPPTLARALHSLPVKALAPLESEEEALIELLAAQCALPGMPGALMTRITARRAMRNDHLWQDMGLPERAALSRLIALVWPELHARNTANMRWKRFFYRALCEAEGFSLCSVPHCRECTEYDSCFGEESGESAFARRVVQLESLKAAE
jgi:nitrogen fixation protein NifQ